MLTPELQKQIVKALKDGAYIETAAASVGIHRSTLHDWLRRGARERRRLSKSKRARPKKREAPFVAFSDTIQRVMADSELDDLRTIKKASKRHWQAAAWRLERKYPDRYGIRHRVEHTGRKDAPVQVEHGLTGETIQAIKREILGLPDLPQSES